jgi:hypothetical protein
LTVGVDQVDHGDRRAAKHRRDARDVLERRFLLRVENAVRMQCGETLALDIVGKSGDRHVRHGGSGLSRYFDRIGPCAAADNELDDNVVLIQDAVS